MEATEQRENEHISGHQSTAPADSVESQDLREQTEVKQNPEPNNYVQIAAEGGINETKDIGSDEEEVIGNEDGENGTQGDEVELLEGGRSFNVLAYMCAKTACCFTVIVIEGIWYGFRAVTQLDQRDRIGCSTTMADMGLTLTFISLGMLIGAPLAGFVADRFHRWKDLVFGLCCVLMVGVLAIKGFSPTVWFLSVVSFLEGVGSGGLDPVAYSIVFSMWGKDAKPPIHLMAVGFPLGMTLAPLIALPFLSVKSPCVNGTSPATISTTTTELLTTPCIKDFLYNTSTTSPQLTTEENNFTVSHVEVPYIIAAAAIAVMALIFLIFALAPKPRGFKTQEIEAQSFRDALHPGSCTGGASGFGVIMVSMLALFYFAVTIEYIPLSNFLVSYAVESELDFPKHEAALLASMGSLSLLIGRLICSFLAHFLPIQPMLFVEVFGAGAIAVAMVFLVPLGKYYLWVLNCAIQLFASAIWPGGFSWASMYFIVSASVVAMGYISSGVSGMLVSWLSGYLYNAGNMDSIFYLQMGGAMGTCVILIVMQIVASKFAPRPAIGFQRLEV